MAQLLGNKFCIESLHNDVSDLQSAITDVFSRAGPVHLASWKYPDKMAADLDVPEMLEQYKYSEEDEEEERQMAHIILLELVIDRLVLLLQAMARYLEQTLSLGRGVGSAQKSSNASIGLVVKKYWNKMVHIHTVVQQLQSENKSCKRKSADLENTVSQLKQDLVKMKEITNGLNLMPPSSAKQKHVPLPPDHCQPGSPSHDIARDEYNKCTQTLETAFVPCESCFRVQEHLKDIGDTVTGVCLTQGLPSSLAKWRAQVEGLEWLTANDVTRWTVEQNKDLSRLGKHMEQLMGTIEPLKTDIEQEQQRKQELQTKLSEAIKKEKLERETQSIQLRQYEARLADVKKKGNEAVNEVSRQKEDLSQAKKALEAQLQEVQRELEQQKNLLKEMDSSKAKLLRDLEEATTNNAQVRTLEADLAKVHAELKETTTELNKERAKNRSVSKHSQALQDKQGSMVSRLDVLDVENDDLRNQVAELEDAREKLEEALERAHEDKHRLERNVKEEQALVKRITSEKETVEDSIRELEDTVATLEKQVSEAKEQQRLMVEYPDLNGPVNPDLAGTGDITVDMENQITANSVRIQVLETQNAKLRRSITKMLQAQSHTTNKVKPPEAPLPLWRPSSSSVARNGISSPHSSGSDTEAPGHPPNADPKAYTFSSKPRNLPPKPPPAREKNWDSDSGGSGQEPFVVRRPPVKSADAAKTRKRPVSGKDKSSKTDKPSSAPNSSSIAAYLQLKKAGLIKDSSPYQNRPISGKSAPPGDGSEYQMQDVFMCQKCDKMYNSIRDLEVHKSYCFGGI